MTKPNFNFNSIRSEINRPKSIKNQGQEFDGVFFTGRGLLGHCKIIMKDMPFFWLIGSCLLDIASTICFEKKMGGIQMLKHYYTFSQNAYHQSKIV